MCGCNNGHTGIKALNALRYVGTGPLPVVFVGPVSKQRFLVNKATDLISVEASDIPGFLAMSDNHKFQKVMA